MFFAVFPILLPRSGTRKASRVADCDTFGAHVFHFLRTVPLSFQDAVIGLPVYSDLLAAKKLVILPFVL